MIASISCNKVSGELSAISSKSFAHRLLIGAAFCDKKTEIYCKTINRDIIATVDCLKSIGAKIEYENGVFSVTPVNEKISDILDCNESGTTMRLILPVVCAIGGSWRFIMRGRLGERPISPLKEELEAHGITFEYSSANELCTKGKLTCGNYSIRGDVSSQFISGLLFALSLLDGKSTLKIIGKLESAPYVQMTLDVLISLGADISKEENIFTIKGKQLRSPSRTSVECDWSNAAFPLCAAAIGGSVTLTNINPYSNQGDAKILDLLKKFGAEVNVCESAVTVSHKTLLGIDIDATDIPDLVPVLATVASVSEGKTRIFGASRLRIKESDRLQTTYTTLRTLGADITLTDDGFIINGKKKLLGGTVSSYNDHRIAMSAAVASAACENGVIVEDANAIQKSYPDFWQDFKKLGFNIDLY